MKWIPNHKPTLRRFLPTHGRAAGAADEWRARCSGEQP